MRGAKYFTLPYKSGHEHVRNCCPISDGLCKYTDLFSGNMFWHPAFNILVLVFIVLGGEMLIWKNKLKGKLMSGKMFVRTNKYYKLTNDDVQCHHPLRFFITTRLMTLSTITSNKWNTYIMLLSIDRALKT